VTRQGVLVRLEWRPLAASYEGRLNREGTKLAGEWRPGGAALPLTFKRSEAGLARPPDPKKPYPYREEEIVIANAAGSVKLGATPTPPNGQGPFPAVMLPTGSGSRDRHESGLGHRPFLVPAGHLTRPGIAVLRAGDRGIGGSTGKLAPAAYGDLAGVEYLKSRQQIGRRQIGLAGHSAGAAIGMTAAGRSAGIAFLVWLAGPGIAGEQPMYEQSRTGARRRSTGSCQRRCSRR
jgi:hypothetical protein